MTETVLQEPRLETWSSVGHRIHLHPGCFAFEEDEDRTTPERTEYSYTEIAEHDLTVCKVRGMRDAVRRQAYDDLEVLRIVGRIDEAIEHKSIPGVFSALVYLQDFRAYAGQEDPWVTQVREGAAERGEAALPAELSPEKGADQVWAVVVPTWLGSYDTPTTRAGMRACRAMLRGDHKAKLVVLENDPELGAEEEFHVLGPVLATDDERVRELAQVLLLDQNTDNVEAEAARGLLEAARTLIHTEGSSK